MKNKKFKQLKVGDIIIFTGNEEFKELKNDRADVGIVMDLSDNDELVVCWVSDRETMRYINQDFFLKNPKEFIVLS